MRRTGLANFQIPWMMVALYLTAAATAYAAEPASSKRIDFNYQIRPILSDKCFNCHGPDPRESQGRAAAGHEGRCFRQAQVGRARDRAGKPRRERARGADHGRG